MIFCCALGSTLQIIFLSGSLAYPDEETVLVRNISTSIAEHLVNASKTLAQNEDIDQKTATDLLTNVSAVAMEKVKPKVQELAKIEAVRAIEQAQANKPEGEKIAAEEAQKIFINSTSSLMKQIEKETKEKSFEKALLNNLTTPRISHRKLDNPNKIEKINLALKTTLDNMF